MTAYQDYRKSQKYLKVEGGEIAYWDQGDGEPILLVHGVPTSSWLYRHMQSDLVNKGYRVIAPDLLGYGSSEKPKGYELYHEKKQGRRLLQLMEHLGISQWNHVMHDAGGLWSWEMISQRPESVKRLVILNTLIYEAGFNPPMRFEKGFKARVYTAMYKSPLTGKGLIKATFDNGMLDCDLTKEDMEGYWLPMKEGGNRALYYFFTQTCNALPNFANLLKSLSIPTRIIWGEKDSILKWDPQAQAVQADLKIPDSEIFILKDRKHFLQEESPQEIAQLIDAFIS